MAASIWQRAMLTIVIVSLSVTGLAQAGLVAFWAARHSGPLAGQLHAEALEQLLDLGLTVRGVIVQTHA